MASASDNFDRANETPIGGNWTPSAGGTSSPNLASNHVTAGATEWELCFYNAQSFGADHYSQGKMNTIYHNNGVAVRVQSGSESGYIFTNYSGTHVYRIYKITNGGSAQLGADYGASTGGDTIRLEISGSTLTPYINGAAQSTRTDSTYSTGAPGLVVFDTSSNMDDWAGGDLATPGNVSAVKVATVGDVKASTVGVKYKVDPGAIAVDVSM